VNPLSSRWWPVTAKVVIRLLLAGWLALLG
jgi:hypothetical protein